MKPDELEAEARDWAWVFWGVIPEDQLRTCQRLAEINPDRNPDEKNFPIKRREVIDAFYKSRAMSSTPIRITECDFCRMHRIDSVQYPGCPFHAPTSGFKAGGAIFGD